MPAGWSDGDYIQFCETRLLDSETELKEWGYGFGHQDLDIWLSSQRDKKSWAEIARAKFPRFWNPDTGRDANHRAISLVRRAFDRVNKFLNQGGHGFVYRSARVTRVRQQILESYILTGMMPVVVSERELQELNALNARAVERGEEL